MKSSNKVLSRIDSLKLASSTLELITSYLVNDNNGSLYNGHSIFDVFKADIIGSASDMLQDERIKKGNHFRSFLRSFVYNNGNFSKNTNLNLNDVKIVIVPKTDSHLVAIFDILRNLNNANIGQILFITFTRSHYHKIKDNGFRCIFLNNYIKLNFFDFIKIFRSYVSNIIQFRKALINIKLDKSVSSILFSSSQFVLSKHLIKFYCLDKLLKNLLMLSEPSVMLIGNSNTYEGRLATIFSKSRGLKTMSIQHGRVDLQDPITNNPLVDTYFTWGRIPNNIMISKGISENNLKIVGAPWLDNFKSSLSKISNDEKFVLVAFSGPGHMTGLKEHKSNVKMITDICKENKDVNFIFKLHIKDKIEYYKSNKRSISHSNIKVIPGHNSDKNIFYFLKKSYLLITTGSTAAIDAMVMGVPVITFNADSFQRNYNEFINFGATYHAKNKNEVNNLIRELISEKFDHTIHLKTQEFLNEYFANYKTRDAKSAISSFIDKIIKN